MFTEMMTTRVRLPRYRPSSAGLMVAAILAFAGGIVVAAMGRNHPPLLLGGWSLAAILAGGGTAYLIQYQRVHSGAQDLVINEGSRTVELPLTYKRKERMRLAYSDIQSVVLEKVAHRGKSSVSYTYAPTLQPKDGTSQRLAEMSQERAESFAAWLREKLGIKADVPVLDEK
jgi:hypothetical protein